MKERPILFSGPMVRAILAGQKTQTRRVMKPQPIRSYKMPPTGMGAKEGQVFIGPDPLGDKLVFALCTGVGNYHVLGSKRFSEFCPFGAPGDRLWLREQLTRPDGDPWLYAADRQPVMVRRSDESAMVVWAHHKEQSYCPSIHMPRWASRITLEVTEVRIERLNDISEKDCWAEGVEQVLHDFSDVSQCEWANKLGCCIEDAKPLFAQLWHTIHAADGPNGWAANPWVWVVGFRRVDA